MGYFSPVDHVDSRAYGIEQRTADNERTKPIGRIRRLVQLTRSQPVRSWRSF